MAHFEAQGDKLLIDGKEIVQGWESFNGFYWFGVEVDHTQDSVISGQVFKNDKIWFGFVQGHEEEWGYFSEAELNLLMRTRRAWEIKPQDLPYAGRRN
jgi:hypothetical protein